MILNERDIRQALQQLEPPAQAAYVKSPKAVRDLVVGAFHDSSFETQGYPIHFPEAENYLRFRRCEVTIWTGQNHTGKSEILNQFLLSQIESEKSFIMSPEMPIYRTVQYMAQQATGMSKPQTDKIDRFLEYVDGRIFLLDQENTFKPQEVIDLIRYVHCTYGCFHYVIDSLMKCGLNENDDHAKVKWFVDQLCVVAKNLGIHVHLVAHSKKPINADRPSRYDIKGSGAISDLVDSVVIMWRNEAKERKLDEGCPESEYVDLMNEPDARMIVDKQRHGNSWTGSIPLWHCQESRSFKQERSDVIRPIIKLLA